MSSAQKGSSSWLPGTQEDLAGSGWAELVADEKEEGRVFAASFGFTGELPTPFLTRVMCVSCRVCSEHHPWDGAHLAGGPEASPGCPEVRSMGFRHSSATHCVSSCTCSLPQFAHL